MAEFVALLVGDRSSKILHLDQSLAYEDDLGDFANAGYPGVAHQLGIERKQTVRLFWVAGGSSLPFDQAAGAVERSDGIDVGDEVILLRQWPLELDLQVAAGLANADAVVLTEPVQELEALLQHPVPAIALWVVKLLVLVSCPFAV